MFNKFGKSKEIVVILSALGGFIFGYNTGVITGALPHIAKEYDMNTVQQGLVVCSVLLGALIGSVSGGLLANIWGRKPILILTAITTIVGGIGIAAIPPIAVVCCVRIILGLGVGASSSVCPLMVAEVIPIEKRGKYGSVFQVFITIGLLMGNVMGVILLKADHNWRWMFGAGAAPGIIMLPFALIVKESPIFLQQQVLKKQTKVLTVNANNNDEDINNNNNMIKKRRIFKKPKGLELLRMKKNRKPMFTGVVLAVFSQLTGINAFIYFSSVIFEFAGFTGTYGPITCSCILQFWNVLTTLGAMYTVDVVGRRILLFTGSIVMTICNFLIAIFFVALSGKVQGWLSIIALFLFIAAFEFSIGTLFWFVINEILDDDVKNIGAPIINALQWLFNLLLSFLFLSAVKYLGRSTMFWVFGGIGLVCIILLWILLPPEKGKIQMDISRDDLSDSQLSDSQIPKLSEIEDNVEILQQDNDIQDLIVPNPQE
ncbi:sugar transporter family protein [Tieghemostelium lacteum]|uniref:Sugar transporter family protein n=1 Tax=Tieghemostelium lacteum TaxID=361077 RepID=A0A152A4X7_TIELA|nr:sugar transporter family protein [Tieghemostelium lacteum]|eukprot:KYR01290.1 sugar transporter family protein [Tieghemostelium lacteum]